jgi:FtsP/CotA-like multicopper oxidase with cupredoxin domain
MVVNGNTWPYLEVEPRLYRFRLLNGCNSRFLVLKFDKDGLNFTQIGAEEGLLPNSPIVRASQHRPQYWLDPHRPSVFC